MNFNNKLDLVQDVSQEYVISRLSKAAGKELESGKFLSPESSSALAVNTFAFFNPFSQKMPPLPKIENSFPAISVDIEYQARFPWRGGRHPWLDAFVETETNIIGIESKRFEPFRDAKKIDISDAYDRHVWGDNMARYKKLRDNLRDRSLTFKYLDAAQLLKHAFGMVTEGKRKSKLPILFYIFAEPRALQSKVISPEQHLEHRMECNLFKEFVKGDEVRFEYCSYMEWLATWPSELEIHANSIIEKFDL